MTRIVTQCTYGRRKEGDVKKGKDALNFCGNALKWKELPTSRRSEAVNMKVNQGKSGKAASFP